MCPYDIVHTLTVICQHTDCHCGVWMGQITSQGVNKDRDFVEYLKRL